MTFTISDHNGLLIAEINSDEVVLSNEQDAVELAANCLYQGAERLIIHEKNIAGGFFDLKTRLAGEILQKFSNYTVQLAIVGDFSRYQSKSLKDFIFESNKGNLVFFVAGVEEAVKRLLE